MSILTDTKPLDASEVALVEANDADMPGQNAYYNRGYDAFREMFGELAEERPDLLPLDATGVFADLTDPVYTDDCHLTPLGRKALAEWIGAALLERWDGAPPRRGGGPARGAIPASG
jgi:hypothetical protein